MSVYIMQEFITKIQLSPLQKLNMQAAVTSFTGLDLPSECLVGLYRCTELGASIDSSSTKLFLNPKKLVILGKTF